MVKRLFILLLVFITIFCFAASVKAADEEDLPPVRTANQEYYHEIAELARFLGFSEESEIIQLCKKLWWEEQEKLDILAKVISCEAGICPWLHRIAVGQVVMNRVASPDFPDTVREVVSQKREWYDSDGVFHRIYQYHPKYCSDFEDTDRQFYEDAKFVLDGNAINTYVPDDIIYQAEFPQGKETWWISEVSYPNFHSTTYFCR